MCLIVLFGGKHSRVTMGQGQKVSQGVLHRKAQIKREVSKTNRNLVIKTRLTSVAF